MECWDLIRVQHKANKIVTESISPGGKSNNEKVH